MMPYPTFCLLLEADTGLHACVARFVAAVGMEKLTARTGRHSLVVLALEKRRESRFDGWLDRLVTELFITGAVHAHAVTSLASLLCEYKLEQAQQRKH